LVSFSSQGISNGGQTSQEDGVADGLASVILLAFPEMIVSVQGMIDTKKIQKYWNQPRFRCDWSNIT
jgi:hypothetical protein